MTDQARKLWMAVRQALIIVIGAIEEYLGLRRSIMPKRKRDGPTLIWAPPGCEEAAREIVRLAQEEEKAARELDEKQTGNSWG